MAFPVGFRDLSKTTKIDAEEQTALSGTLLICMSRTSSLPRRSRPPNPKTIEIVTHRFPEVFPESFPERNPRIQFYESVEKLAPGSASRNTSRNATPGFPERFPEPFPEPPPAPPAPPRPSPPLPALPRLAPPRPAPPTPAKVKPTHKANGKTSRKHRILLGTIAMKKGLPKNLLPESFWL